MAHGRSNCDGWAKEGVDPKVARRKASARRAAAASIGGQEALLEVLANTDHEDYAETITEVMSNATRLAVGQPMQWARASISVQNLMSLGTVRVAIQTLSLGGMISIKPYLRVPLMQPPRR